MNDHCLCLRHIDMQQVGLSFRKALFSMLICITTALCCFSAYPIPWQGMLIFLFFCHLLLIALVDMHTLLIPNRLLLSLLLTGLIFLLEPFACSWLQRCIGMFGASGMMLAVNLLQKDSFGCGDIKLMLICGFYLGAICSILAMLIALLSGGAFALCFILGKRIKPTAHMAFAPFLCFGMFIAYLYGTQILTLYLELFW